MQLILKVLTLTILASNAFGQDNRILYPIKVDNLWGYIDKTGTIIIKPQFYSAGVFSEGLASARLNGAYGYIDVTGTFIIPPKYDVVNPFIDGQAIVYIAGKPIIIDKKGNITFQHNFKSISSFGKNSFAIVVAQNDRSGVINRNGELIVDTIFKTINSFTDGLAVVSGQNHLDYTGDPSKEIICEVGVIDTTGKWIVPYGRFNYIEPFKNGFSKVELSDQNDAGNNSSNHTALIDTEGNQLFIFPVDKYRFEYGNEGFYNDVAVVNIYPDDEDNMASRHSWERIEYKGAIDSEGHVILSDTSWRELSPFAYNRAFAQDDSGYWKMINKNGEQVGDSLFENIAFTKSTFDVPDIPFQNGIAFVKLKRGWCAIDTLGAVLTEPRIFINELEYLEIIRKGNTLFLMKDISTENPDYPYSFGFFNSSNNVLVEPMYHEIDMNNFDDDVIYAMKDGLMYYITNSGNIIWKETITETKNKLLNIDFKNRGYFYASSQYKKELAAYGGWGGSDNQSKSVSEDIIHSNNQLQVIINPNMKTKWAEEYEGMKLFVANTSEDTLFFPAQDSRLYLKIQAQDPNGLWKDIEYLPSSWCGNSYHTLFLAPNELWEFSSPIYHGEFKTKIRAQLFYKKTPEQTEDEIIYSNEIEGYINPGQFWNKRKFSSSGLMDPYND